MENNDCGMRRVRAPSEKLGAHESERGTDGRNLPRESSPTRRAEKAAREYGGVCSTERPDEKVRLLMGGDVCAARYGSIERNVEGGISAGRKASDYVVDRNVGRGGEGGQHLPTPRARFQPPQTSSSPTTPRRRMTPSAAADRSGAP